MVDVTAQLTAVTREVADDVFEGAAVRVQRIGQNYPTTIDDVWGAVTSAERIPRWFSPVSGDLELGGRYQITGNASGEVLQCEPPRDGAASYRISWEFGGGVSWVEVSLLSRADHTTGFVLTHTAPVDAVPPGFWELYGPGATGVGWDLSLLGLALHLASDESISRENADEWPLSEEGKAFVRGASDGWAQAQIAMGDDPDQARRGAAATYGFYTGTTPDGM